MTTTSTRPHGPRAGSAATTTGLRARPLPRAARRLLASPVFEALATPHGMSRYLEQVSPLWSLAEDRAIVTDVDRTTAGAVTLTLRAAGDRLPHRAGQHVRLSVDVDGVRSTRCYSVIDPEGSDPRTVTLTVRTHDDGTVSRHLADAEAGLVVGLSQPAGTFVLPDARPDRVLLVSGGSGITPVLSMLRTLVSEGHAGEITFLHYARDAASLLHADELVRIAASHPNVRIVTVLTREPAADGLRGHLDRAHLDAVAPDRATAHTFACGPLALLDGLAAIYADEGLSERLHREQFEAPATVIDLDDPTATAGTVTFADSAVAVDNSGQTLLEQAEAAGLTPESGCRMGICHSCTTRLTCGSVRNVVTGAVTDTETDVQLCVSVPLGDVALDV